MKGTFDYLPGRWQVVDFRVNGARAVWDRPPLHVDDESWVVFYMSSVLVIATSRSYYGGGPEEPCFFIHESLVERLSNG